MDDFKPRVFKKLPLPETSVWDKKTYDPILWFYKRKESWSNTSEKIFDIWFAPKRFLRETWRFLKRLKVWIPILWRDRDWDDFYIFEILKTKILTQRKYLVENYRHTSIPQVNRDMTTCLNLIERFQKSHYEIEQFDFIEYDSNFVKVDGESDEGEDVYTLNSKVIRDDLLGYLNKYPKERDKAIKEMKSERNEDLGDYVDNSESRQKLALHLSRKMHEKCRKLIFRIMDEKIEGWWD